MKRHDPPRPVHEGAPTTDAHGGRGAPEPREPDDGSLSALDERQIVRLLEQHPLVEPDPGDAGPAPKIRRMPEGIEVVEHRVGVAAGQWLLEVRCECGRRWFEIEAVPTATCPRCGRLVCIEVAGLGPKG